MRLYETKRPPDNRQCSPWPRKWTAALYTQSHTPTNTCQRNAQAANPTHTHTHTSQPKRQTRAAGQLTMYRSAILGANRQDGCSKALFPESKQSVAGSRFRISRGQTGRANANAPPPPHAPQQARQSIGTVDPLRPAPHLPVAEIRLNLLPACIIPHYTFGTSQRSSWALTHHPEAIPDAGQLGETTRA